MECLEVERLRQAVDDGLHSVMILSLSVDVVKIQRYLSKGLEILWAALGVMPLFEHFKWINAECCLSTFSYSTIT